MCFNFVLCEPHTQFIFVLCLTATFYWFLFFAFFFVCFLFYVLCWLTGPCVACLMSCPSLNVARQSAEPWAPKSTKVKLTRLPATTCPPPSSPKDSLLHCSPTSKTQFPSHGPNDGDTEWQRVGLHQHYSRDFLGWLYSRCLCSSILFSCMYFPTESLQAVLSLCFFTQLVASSLRM